MRLNLIQLISKIQMICIVYYSLKLASITCTLQATRYNRVEIRTLNAQRAELMAKYGKLQFYRIYRDIVR